MTDIIDVTPWPRQIYDNADSFWQESKGLHYAYMVYRTLRGDYKHIFQPDAVFYVGRSPAAYLKKVNAKTISDEDIRQWQRFLWNQAVVPLLIVKSRNRVHVYTAYTKPEKNDSQQRIQSILEYVADTLELEQLWTAIESGMIYRQRPEAFLRDNAVDRYLIVNLNATALRLADTQSGETKVEKENNLKFAHHFLTRLLFVCYLIERGMIQGKKFEDENLKKIKPATEKQRGHFLRHLFEDVHDNRKRRDLLCEIFEYVKEKFNGSLFPDDVAKEKNLYTDDFIREIDRFLHGHDRGTGQMVLGFWAYDFSVIPIETISAIWESFLGEQGKLREAYGDGDSKRETGAYYTPLHLAELTVDVALEDIENKTNKPIHELEILDPACGSGVFLVSMFCRIAEDFYRSSKITTGIDWARKLKPKLNQLYGLDMSDTACHITCFSLYLAYLEWLEPNDVEDLLKHGERLPPLLANTEDSWDTIHHNNIFNLNLSIERQEFDIVIGNPPWVSRGKQKDEYFIKWQEAHPSKPCPSNQIAHGFMWEVPRYLSESGIGCLLLPAAVLFNITTNTFQKRWLNSVSAERVVNLSDLRFVLFSGADHPGIIIRFRKSASKSDGTLLYESPKTDALSQQGGPVYTREEDTTILQIKDILRAAKNKNAPVIWKLHYWGSWRDQRLLSRLRSLKMLNHFAGEPEQKKRWIKGQGIQINGSDDNKVWWKPSTSYLDSKIPFNFVVCEKDFKTTQKAGIPLDTVHRPRKKKLFVGPKVLLAKGSRRVLFCKKLTVFKDVFTAITGPNEDSTLLRFLAAVLSSDLIYYYLFHTNSNLGIYRPQIYPREFLSVPFFLPEDAHFPKRANEIVTEVAKRVEKFEKYLEEASWFGEEQRRQDESIKIRRELEPLVRAYYNIDEYESMVIDDTLELAVKSFHPRQDQENIPTLREPQKGECKTYAKTLCEMLNHFGKGSQFKVRGEVFKGVPYSVVQVSLTDRILKSVPITDTKKELASVLTKMESLLQEKNEPFAFCQNLKVFDGDSLYVLKPMQMRFWSKTAALNDADEIAGYILQIRRGN
ncbi:MAG: hypothetical protein A2Z25_03820 [Planctomycetes bacterium RBG_16_55_9]|nr:MAG: hypothetical protein A2Z25_03820 [Planctomycetes bacterium RBG_16_55_9]